MYQTLSSNSDQSICLHLTPLLLSFLIFLTCTVIIPVCALTISNHTTIVVVHLIIGQRHQPHLLIILLTRTFPTILIEHVLIYFRRGIHGTAMHQSHIILLRNNQLLILVILQRGIDKWNYMADEASVNDFDDKRGRDLRFFELLKDKNYKNF